MCVCCVHRFDEERKSLQTRIKELEDELAKLRAQLSAANGTVAELNMTVTDKAKIIQDLEQQLRDTEKLYNESKISKHAIGDKDAEIHNLKAMNEQLQHDLAEEREGNRKRVAGYEVYCT